MIIERTFYVPNGDIVFHNGVVYEIKGLRKFENGIFSYSAFEINYQDLEERMEKLGKKSVKHWCVTEKGHTNTRRIHLHGLYYAREGQTKWQLTNLLS